MIAMELLRSALNNDADVALDAAALEIARIEFPDLNPQPYLEVLDGMAARIAARLPSDAGGTEFVEALNREMFREAGFKANRTDYYNPSNSCLNVVLDTKLGIPITLSLVYMEVARRLGRTILGIGLPGHFVVEYRDKLTSMYLDPFHNGRTITAADCNEIALDHAQVEIVNDAAALRPVSNSYILTRMLNNLRGAYFRAGDFKKGASVLDLLVETFPQNSEYFKARAVARMQLRQFRGANADFRAYLGLAPEAPDRAEIVQQLEQLQRWLSSLN